MIDGLENNPVQHVTNSSDHPETNIGTFTTHQIGNLDLTLHSHSLKAGSLLCIPEEASLENYMRVYKEQVNKQLTTVASAKDDVEALKETNMVLTGLTKQLLEQNDVLVSSLVDVAREGECRAVQMQKRLRESAQATKDVVLTMSDWGEEIRDLIIRKCQAENLIHEAETSLSALRNENHSLKEYNENLWHDIQSLLNIIKEARSSGHWEMGLVTFCEISPEDVFGPICRLSAKHHPDPFLRHDNNSTDDLVLLEQPLAEESVLYKPDHVGSMSEPQSPRCSSDDNEQGILNGNAPSSMAESLKEHSSAHNEAPCLSECHDLLTPAVDTTKILCNGFTKSNEESMEGHSGGSVVLEQEQSQCTGLKREYRSVCQDGLLKGRPPSRARSLLNGLQGSSPEEPYDTPCGPYSPADCKRVLFPSSPPAKGSDCFPVAEPSKVNCAAQTEEKETSSVVMGTQTDFLSETCLPSGNEVRGQELGSLRERLNLALQDEYRSVCQDGLLKGRPPSRARSLLNGLQGSSPEEPYDTPCGPYSPADCKRVLFPSSPPAKGSDCFPVAEPSKVNCAAQTEEKETSSVVMGTQTDFLSETCLPSGNEVRDQELGSLRERLNLALQDAQSKTLLAMQLQAHLDASAMQVELRDQALQNLEKKLTMSRENCDHLKKDMISVRFELEEAQQAIEKERTLRAQSVAEAEQLTLTVQHLREALVSSKRAMEEARRSSKDDTVTHNNLSRVHDI
ncbi:uncharacterized protein LOC115317713 isoform X2 [Ixodes scapularis]|uniref:uncharacterized protein LOC115317713 isoform X2 n=1 Tax=Ixodes scapularis TaxID=6945 RepID=UPI001A9FF7A8|nr:uncharacterized protein LOC115317713 isoform X2 [Ixodes scapularis]